MSLKVLQLGKFYPVRGGVEKVEYDLMLGLSERQVMCDMLCAASEGGGRIIPVNKNARLICCRTWKKVAATMISPSMIFVLRRLCKQYDIIHVHHPDPMACLALFLSGYTGKVVVHWHSDIQKQKTLLRAYRPLQDWLLRRADLIVGTTPVYLKESPYLKSVQAKAICLPIGVRPMQIGVRPMHPEQKAVEAVRRRYRNRKIIFSLGRLVHYKGYSYLVDAARYLGDDYVVLIGGTGALKDELQNQIKSLALQEKVYRIQKTEAFGIVQIEAMSCGKPVVATTIPQSGVSWVNAHGLSGLNVEPGNAPALAEAIREITGDPVVYKGYCERALQRYETCFTAEQMIINSLNQYKSLCK